MIVIKDQEEIKKYYDEDKAEVIFGDDVKFLCPVLSDRSDFTFLGTATMEKSFRAGWIESQGSIISKESIESKGTIKSGGVIESQGSIESGEWIESKRLIISKGSIISGEWIKSGGSIECGGSVISGGSVECDGAIISKGSILSGGVIESKGRIEGQGSIKSGECIISKGAIISLGSIISGEYIFSFNYDIAGKSLQTRTLPFERKFWAEMPPIQKWKEDILNEKLCWKTYKNLPTMEEKKKICSWDGWHWIIRAQLEMFFGLKKIYKTG